VIPLTCGIGSILFVTNADVLFVQSHFDDKIAPFYSAVAMLGVGLVSFTAPISTVMFPKLVSSFAKSERSNSFMLALGGTALLCVSSALVCTIFPRLPLRIIHFNKPEFWVSDQLVPWFMWAMAPLTVANVLTNNLLAKSRFAVVPWLVAAAVGYGLSLDSYLSTTQGLPHFTVFKGVVLRLGGFSCLLLLVATVFSALDARKNVRA
jgi:O-antigen/teichoic acid export membrane protein